jgi:hypothetical protein
VLGLGLGSRWLSSWEVRLAPWLLGGPGLQTSRGGEEPRTLEALPLGPHQPFCSEAADPKVHTSRFRRGQKAQGRCRDEIEKVEAAPRMLAWSLMARVALCPPARAVARSPGDLWGQEQEWVDERCGDSNGPVPHSPHCYASVISRHSSRKAPREREEMREPQLNHGPPAFRPARAPLPTLSPSLAVTVPHAAFPLLAVNPHGRGAPDGGRRPIWI